MINNKIKYIGILVLVFLLSFCSVAYASRGIRVTKVTLNKTKVTLNIGESTLLRATITPKDASNKKMTWKSSDTNIVSYRNGKITGIKAGTATITVTTVDAGKTANCKVTVIDPIITFKDISLENEIKKVLNITTGDITRSQLSTITILSLSNKNISDVSGIENCTKLTEVDLSYNQISNVKPLYSLTGLKLLDLEGNPILKEDMDGLTQALPSCDIQGPNYNTVENIY